MRKYTSLPYTEYPVAIGHFDKSRSPITTIVLHSSASTRQGLINTFGGGTRQVSAHYGVDNDGSLLAFLEEYWTAFHSGNYAMNQKSIGIEHIDNGASVKLHTDQQYQTSIKLIADICTYYKITPSKSTIIPHSAVTATACPNGLDVDRIITGVQNLINKPIDTSYNDLQKKILDLEATEKRLQEEKAQIVIDAEKKLEVEKAKIQTKLDTCTEQSKALTDQLQQFSTLQDTLTDLKTQNEDLTKKLEEFATNSEGLITEIKHHEELTKQEKKLKTAFNREIDTLVTQKIQTYNTKELLKLLVQRLIS